MTLHKPCLNCNQIGDNSAACEYDSLSDDGKMSIRVFCCHECGAIETVTVLVEKLNK